MHLALASSLTFLFFFAILLIVPSSQINFSRDDFTLKSLLTLDRSLATISLISFCYTVMVFWVLTLSPQSRFAGLPRT